MYFEVLGSLGLGLHVLGILASGHYDEARANKWGRIHLGTPFRLMWEFLK